MLEKCRGNAQSVARILPGISADQSIRIFQFSARVSLGYLATGKCNSNKGLSAKGIAYEYEVSSVLERSFVLLHTAAFFV